MENSIIKTVSDYIPLVQEKFPELIKKLKSNYIQPDDVTLNKKYIIGGENHE